MFMSSRYFAVNKLRIKRKECFKFYHLHVLLSCDVTLNLLPSQYLPDNNNKFELVLKRDLHVLHINVNSLLSKSDEPRDVIGHTKPAILGITESKLDRSVSNQKVNISGYSIHRCDGNRYGGGVTCYVRADLCLNRRNVFSNSIENVFFDLLIPKLKPLLIGIFYRPPNVNTFLETFVNNLELIDLKKLKFIFLEILMSISLIPKYKDLCKKFSLKAITKEPTRIIRTTSSLLDHILTNIVWKIS